MKKKTRRKADSTRMGLGCSESRRASDGLRKMKMRKEKGGEGKMRKSGLVVDSWW
jgi:hypothetical protein